MLKTVEATLDPTSGVHFIEPVQILKPVRVLVTFMETEQVTSFRPSSESTALDQWLLSSAAAVSDRTPEEMDQYIQELRTS